MPRCHRHDDATDDEPRASCCSPASPPPPTRSNRNIRRRRRRPPVSPSRRRLRRPSPAPPRAEPAEPPTPSNDMNFDLMGGDDKAKKPAAPKQAAEKARIEKLERKVHLRRALLQVAQALGFVTLAALAVTDVIGTLNYYDKYVGRRQRHRPVRHHARSARHRHDRPLRHHRHPRARGAQSLSEAAQARRRAPAQDVDADGNDLLCSADCPWPDHRGLRRQAVPARHGARPTSSSAGARSRSWASARWLSSSEVTMDRRTFLQTTAAGGALVTIGVGAPGCGNPVSPAPLAKIMTVASTDAPSRSKTPSLFDNPLIGDAYGTVQLLVEFYPQLAVDGGAITLAARQGDPVDRHARLRRARPTTRSSSSTSRARSTPCSRAARTPRCPLGYRGGAMQQIECPCHSSRFEANPRRRTSARCCTGRRTRRSCAG